MLNLNSNPFEHQFTYDFDDYKSQPFLEELHLPNILKRKLLLNATARGQRILLKVISAKGAGKSTLSFYLQDNLIQLKDEGVIVFYTNTISTGYYKLLENLIFDFNINKKNYGELNNEQIVQTFLQDKRLFLFIDFQDNLTSTSLKILADTLERLGTLSHNISIILTLNKNHAVKMENYSYVLGKYSPFELENFSLSETNNLIKERLKTARYTDYKGDEMSPLNKVSELIFKHTGGIPRNILSACDLLISNSDDEEIDLETAEILLKGEFAKKVICDMTEDDFDRAYLIQIYDVIKNNFNGEISKEKDLHDFLEKNFRWSNRTSRKRIRKLSSFGLINITKGADLWSNTIRII